MHLHKTNLSTSCENAPFFRMKSSKKSAEKNSDGAANHTEWGAVVGSIVGLALGLFTRNWIVMTACGGGVGFVVGAFLDRARGR